MTRTVQPRIWSTQRLGALLLGIGLLGSAALPLRAQGAAASEASAMSLLPVASLVAAPVALLSGGAMLTVVAVQASADGTVWLLERSADGARASMQLSAQAAGGASVVAGTSVLVTAVAAGWLLSAAGKAIAFVPNAVGASLMHHERVSR